MTKFYVVWVGKRPGVYSSWDECKAQVIGYPGSKYKSFPTRQQAEMAFNGEESKPTVSAAPPAIAVDAAYSSSTGLGECRGVLIPCGTEVFKAGPWPETTNNIMEFLAIVKGLTWMCDSSTRIPLYSDSKTAIGWVKKKGKCNTDHVPSAGSVAREEIDRAERWIEHAKREYPDVFGLINKWDTKKLGEIPADFGRK